MLDRRSEKVIKARTAEVLTKLTTNREQHQKLVQEARTGYVDKAREALLKRLEQLKDGSLVDLSFKLSPPMDRTKEYDTAIAMLQLHSNAGEEFIELTATDVRQFVLDEWDWTDALLLANSAYSDGTMDLARAKGLR